ncbi:MAG: glycoside hydrolase family protein [Bacteroidetes bacterium]|jgi:lysozyme|nr:glycoside hydrolase family protein [Bacteroidota bacterium]
MYRKACLIIITCCWITACSTAEKTVEPEPSVPVETPVAEEVTVTVEPVEPVELVELVEPVEPVEPEVLIDESVLLRQPANLYRTNDACIDIIKESEGLRLEAYQGLSGHWYIGYGHQGGVTEGMTITEAEAEQYLRDDLRAFEENISRLVGVGITGNEFSAMVCLSYNIGSGNFGQSTVLRKVNEEKWDEAADAILMWNKVNGQVNSHLVSRREKERELFLSVD